MKFSSAVATLIALSASTAVHAKGGLGAPVAYERELLDSNLAAQEMMPLTKEKMNLIYHAANYSQDIYAESQWEADHGVGSVLKSDDPNEVDAVGYKSNGHYCFVVYRGTDNPDVGKHDWYQNFNAATETVNGCRVHSGFHGAASSLKDHTTAFIDACMAEHEGKQLILTGHSQGAGAAGVASILYADYNPLTIGFAQPTFLKEACGLLNPEHNWRITNTENAWNGIRYDVVAFLSASRIVDTFAVGPSIGPLIVLPPNDKGKVDFSPLQTSVYVRPASEPEPWQHVLDIDGDFNTHDMETHRKKIEYLFNQIIDGGHADTSGFIKDTQCDLNEECQGMCKGALGKYAKCVNGDIGDGCAFDGDCKSEHCDYSWTCQPKVGLGGSCWEHETCESGYCGYSGTCSDLKPNGGDCHKDSQCDSKRCDWSFHCAAKMESGAYCGDVHHNDGDCKSGECSYSWRNGWRCE